MDTWAKGNVWDLLPHEWKVKRAEASIELAKKMLGEWENKEKEAREKYGPNPKPWECLEIRRTKHFKKKMKDNLLYWEGVLADLLKY